MLTHFPPWRYPHLFKLWQQWLADGQQHQLDRWLGQQFRQHKQFGKKDRNAYRDAFFAAMRYLQLAYALEYSYRNTNTDWRQWDKSWQATSTECGSAEFWYWLLLRAGVECPCPNELEDGEARQQHFEKIATQWPALPLLTAEGLLWHGFRPSWSEALSLRQQHSGWATSELETFIKQCNEAAPICLRPQNGSAEVLAAALAAEQVETQPSPYGLVATSRINVQQSDSYLHGKFELQDTASQALAASVTLGAHETLWDVCAGAGGKSLAFADAAPTAQILASDIRCNALKQLTQRCQRGKFTNINIQQHDATQALPEPLLPTNGFDWIFIDAPCSAAGTWRRAADTRWRMDNIGELIILQQTILTNAAKHLCIGGQLVYATCSWLSEENEAQVTAFLGQNPQFTLREQQCLGSPKMNADTMFFAKLQRTK